MLFVGFDNVHLFSPVGFEALFVGLLNKCMFAHLLLSVRRVPVVYSVYGFVAVKGRGIQGKTSSLI